MRIAVTLMQYFKVIVLVLQVIKTSRLIFGPRIGSVGWIFFWLVAVLFLIFVTKHKLGVHTHTHTHKHTLWPNTWPFMWHILTLFFHLKIRLEKPPNMFKILLRNLLKRKCLHFLTLAFQICTQITTFGRKEN